MLNNLPLIIVTILSLFLAFYCVDSHKSNILSMVNTNQKNMEPILLKVEENLSKQKVKSLEKVYVEVLAIKDINETESQVQVVEKLEEVKVKVESEYSEGYKLNDLEKMILEELKKGNKE